MTYDRDDSGNLVWMTYGNGSETSWTYNARNQLQTKTYADGTQWHYTYDAAGNRTSRTDALGRTTSYTYTTGGWGASGEIPLQRNPEGEMSGSERVNCFAFGRPTNITYPNDPPVTLTFDAAGRLTGMTDATGTTTWTRDAWGRATSTQPLTGRTIQHAFNAAGQRATATLSGAGDLRTITYTYDQAARLRSLTDSAVGAQPFIYDYQPGTNWTATLTTPTGSTTRSERDNLGRVKETRFHGSGGQPLSGFAYTYDAAGQRSTESGPRGNIAFGYNSRSELTTATGHAAGPFAYAYDPIGNRLTATQASASLTYTPNALNQYTHIEQSGTAFTPIHDLNGNMTDDGKSLTLTYDEENRLIRIAQQKHGKHLVSEFTYDGLSRRVETREYENGQLIDATRYLYDGLLPIEEYKLHNSSFTPHTFLTRGPDLSGTLEGAGGIGGLVAFTENASTSSKLTRSAPLRNSAQWANPAGLSVSHLPSGARLADANGNITALYNASDTTTATYTYDPFGRLVNATGPLATRNTYQWSSKEHHAGSGLVYYLYRFYNPEEGRWINRDPIEEPGGVNLYSTVRNNPANRFDYLGLTDRADIAKGNLSYTCNCGWVDWGHANPTNAKNLWSQISTESGRPSADGQGFYVAPSMVQAKKAFGIKVALGVSGEYWVKSGLSKTAKESVALGIFQEVSHSFESFQSGMVFPFFGSKSGFSEEDLVSNLIGFYIAVKGYSLSEVKQWCKDVGVSNSERIWDEGGGLRKNMKWKPSYRKTSCCKSVPAWPSKLDVIKPIPKGGSEWRNWFPVNDDWGYDDLDVFNTARRQ